MKRFLIPMLCAIALGSSYAVQQDLEKPILKINEQIVTTKDLELVKAMLPLEKFKTSKGKTKLIDGIYTQFLIQKTLLEQNGMKKVTTEDVQKFLGSNDEDVPSGYTPEGYANKRLLARNLSAISVLGIADRIGNLGDIEYDEIRHFTEMSAKEQQIFAERIKTAWLLYKPEWGSVKARAILVDSEVKAKLLERQVRQGADFAKLARQNSLVRASVGGSVTGSEQPERILLERLEPELQLGIAQNSNQKLFLVAAPFGRFWLVQILAVHKIIDTPKGFLTPSQKLSASLNQSTDLLFSTGENQGVFFLSNPSLQLLEKPFKLEVLDASLAQIDPVVAEVGKAKAKLATAFAAVLLSKAAENYLSLEKQMIRDLETWMTTQAKRQGLPFEGAGTEFGLEPYLAARVKVSEQQLKGFFNAKKNKYVFYNAVDEAAFHCTFDTATYAADWQKVFLLLPSLDWVEQIAYPLSHCDYERESEPIPFLEKLPSATSLRPIAGGFMTKIFNYQNKFVFFVLSGYTPKPIFLPFNFVRGQVEREYRRVVAKKQLPAFESALRQRAGAKNLLEQALKDLEQ